MVRLADYIKRDGTLLSETDRVVGLDQVWDYPEALEWANTTFLKPGATWSFRPAQADALYAMSREKGLLAPIGVGHGKTLISWLAPTALQVKSAVIMMPPRDTAPFGIETTRYESQFRRDLDIKIDIVPYSMLSQPESTDLLERLAPAAIICDEVHCLADYTSARTKRFLRYMEEHPETLFVGMSGTLYKKSITDVAHLAWLALKRGSPMPDPASEDLKAWSRVLDVKGMAEAHEYKWFEQTVTKRMKVSDEVSGTIKRARKAAYLRLASCPGVVTTESASCDMGLTIHKVEVAVPQHVQDLVAAVKTSKASPDGEDVYATDAHHIAAMRNITSGFWYKWDWNAIGGRNEDWIMRRSAWNRALNNELENHSGVGYDSPKLVGDRVDKELAADPGLANQKMLYFAREKWNEVSHLPEPPRLTVWVDKYLIDKILDLYKDGPYLFWYDSNAFQEELESRGIPCYGAGTSLTGPERRLAASINAHGQGRNLQDWKHAVVLEPSLGGSAWEQLLGRLHRGGQTRNVQYDLIVAGGMFEQSINNARADARFIEDMSGSPQRLLTSSWT